MKYPENVITAFKAQFGHPPTLVVRAPGRINLIGEHTDYNQGFVLPAAIDKAVYFAAAPLDAPHLDCLAENFGAFVRIQLTDIQPVAEGWPNFLLGVYDELQKAGFRPGGVQLVMGGDIPAGAGLSSSAAVESGMLHVLNHLYQLNIPTLELVKLAQRSENNFIGLQCGIMDMFASQMGREQCAIRLDCRSLAYEYVPFHAEAYRLVLCDTAVKHNLADSEYNTRRATCEESVRLLQPHFPAVQSLRDVTPEMLGMAQDLLPPLHYRRCKHIVTENARVLASCAALEQDDFVQFGALMFASHDSLQHDYEVSCAELDFLVAQARTNPAVAGARMMGGGFGGCTLNLVENTGVEAFEKAQKAAYLKEFGVELHCFGVNLVDGVGVVMNDE